MNSSGRAAEEVAAASLPLSFPTSGSPAAPHFLEQDAPLFFFPALYRKLLSRDAITESPPMPAPRSTLGGSAGKPLDVGCWMLDVPPCSLLPLSTRPQLHHRNL